MGADLDPEAMSKLRAFAEEEIEQGEGVPQPQGGDDDGGVAINSLASADRESAPSPTSPTRDEHPATPKSMPDDPVAPARTPSMQIAIKALRFYRDKADPLLLMQGLVDGDEPSPAERALAALGAAR